MSTKFELKLQHICYELAWEAILRSQYPIYLQMANLCHKLINSQKNDTNQKGAGLSPDHIERFLNRIAIREGSINFKSLLKNAESAVLLKMNIAQMTYLKWKGTLLHSSNSSPITTRLTRDEEALKYCVKNRISMPFIHSLKLPKFMNNQLVFSIEIFCYMKLLSQQILAFKGDDVKSNYVGEDPNWRTCFLMEILTNEDMFGKHWEENWRQHPICYYSKALFNLKKDRKYQEEFNAFTNVKQKMTCSFQKRLKNGLFNDPKEVTRFAKKIEKMDLFIEKEIQKIRDIEKENNNAGKIDISFLKKMFKNKRIGSY